MKRSLIGYTFPILIILVAGWMLLRLSGGPAPTPQAFAEGLSLEQAQTLAHDSGKSVLVFATADWCGPCQQLKRTSLADERVNEAILEHTVPAYLDLTHARNQPDVAAVAREMGIQSVPALLLLRDGEVVSRRGAMSSMDILNWLEAH